jgi:hypothetical protein
MKKEAESVSKLHFEYVLSEPENKTRMTKMVCTLGYLSAFTPHLDP